MISQQSQKLIDKKWPGIKDNKVLLLNAKQELLNFAYIFTVPPDAEGKFLARAQKKAKSLHFAAVGMVIITVLTFVTVRINIGSLAAFGDSFTFLFIAVFVFLLYKDRMKLITCYNELMSESPGTDGNKEKQEI